MNWWNEIGVSAADALLIVVTTVSIYLAVVVYTRVAGQRSVASFSTFDFVASVAIGALVGRVILVRTSLLSGLLGLAVLFLVEAGIGYLRDRRGLGRWVDNEPVLLMAGRKILHDNLRRAHLAERDLRERLRMAGIRDLAEIHSVIMERNGSVSILRGEVVDSWLLEGISGADQRILPDSGAS